MPLGTCLDFFKKGFFKGLRDQSCAFGGVFGFLGVFGGKIIFAVFFSEK